MLARSFTALVVLSLVSSPACSDSAETAGTGGEQADGGSGQKEFRKAAQGETGGGGGEAAPGETGGAGGMGASATGGQGGAPLVISRSDTFTVDELHAKWSFSSPENDCELSVDGAEVSISVPGGSEHDLWLDNNGAARLLQDYPDTDFSIEVGMRGRMDQAHQVQGLIFEESDGRFLRVDYVTDNTFVTLFAAYVDTESQVVSTHTQVNLVEHADGQAPDALRVLRQGDTWTVSTAFTGESFIEAVQFEQPMTVSRVGLSAGNASAGSELAPAYEARFDYFIDSAFPLTDSD